jgi:hypothetical protein
LDASSVIAVVASVTMVRLPPAIVTVEPFVEK